MPARRDERDVKEKRREIVVKFTDMRTCMWNRGEDQLKVKVAEANSPKEREFMEGIEMKTGLSDFLYKI